ncbi:sensor histidine kinase [Pseudonocardia sp. DSM 110487]|uniref:ATP-binding protein n=1 Tax=Pseudonocardia sp. DSM 110487 TaxID=2865833 RepID=UPI001C6957AB|nr:ATP-binding protein [Pseudonocardia sp. DSM 110487]QYN31823.1 sensor histidine kinase [Pseudonocardia sp. DSM 110487]
MRIETTRSANAVRLEHAAGFHGSTTELLDQLVPLAEQALERDEPLAIALQPATEHAVADRLGGRLASADGLVHLRRPDSGPAGASAQTLAAGWALELRALSVATARPVTVLNEHAADLDGADGRFWTELDAALNVALADLPVRITCFYPELPLHLEILDGARRNHPLLLADGELRHNPGHHDPRAVLTARPAARPPLLGPPDVRLSFSAWQLHDVRTSVERALTGRGYERERLEDIVLAVNELATNAVEHGTPEAQLSLWTGEHGLLCEIDDGGTLRDPLPGLQAPHPAEPRGRGVWIARQLCDSLHVWADARGTHVRVHATP